MARFTAGSAGFVYILLGRVVFVYFFRISPVKLKFSMYDCRALMSLIPEFWKGNNMEGSPCH